MIRAIILATLIASLALADAVVFSGNDVKTLKQNIDLFGVAKILSGSLNPSSGGGVVAPIGSIYMSTSVGMYEKTGAGNTAWTRYVINGSSPTFASPTVTGDITLSSAQFNNSLVGETLVTASSTGLISGGVMSVNATPSLFDIAVGTGHLVDYSVPATPTIKHITFGPFTGQSVPNLASQDFTHVMIDSTGAIALINSPPTPAQRRQNIYLGRLNHSNRVSISFADTVPDFNFAPQSQVGDLMDSLGPFNVSGNVISANGANLNINKSAGRLFVKGFGYTASTLDPNTVTTAGLTAGSFAYQNQSGASGSSTALIDPTNYDLAGVTTAVGGTSVRSTVQRIYLFPSNNIRIQRGQEFYTNLANAINAIPSQSFVVNPINEGVAVLIAYLAIERGCTNLSSTCAHIVPVAKFGATASGAGATTNLQQAYDNSSQPQMVVNSTAGGLQVRDASTPIAASLFAVQNNAGSTNYLNVQASSVIAGVNFGIKTTPSAELHVLGQGVYENQAVSATGSYNNFWKHRNFGAVVADDELGTNAFYGSGGSGLLLSASMGALVDGAVTSTSVPSRLDFYTTAVAATTPSLALRIGNDKRATFQGGVTVSTFGTGIVKSSSAGVLSSSAVDLSTADVTGVAPIARGGTNNGSLGVTAGGAVYTDGSKLMTTAAGTTGQVLTSNGASAPTWTTVSGGGLPTAVGSASPSAASSTTISSLDCNTTKNFKIVLKGVWSGSDGIIMFMRPNNDTTSSSYYGTRWFYYSSTPVSNVWESGTFSRAEILRKGYASDNRVLLEIKFYCDTTGGDRPIYVSSGWGTSSQPDGGFQHSGGVWKNTSTNVTSILFNYGGGTFTGSINIYPDSL